MLPKPATCAPCPLATIGLGFSRPVGPAADLARLVFVGEALGAEEARAGEGFVGAAGGMLSRLCAYAAIDRARVRIENVCRCRPPNDYMVGAPWETGAVDHCARVHLAEDTLRALPTGAAVVALGGVATRRLLGLDKARFKLEHWHASPIAIAPGEGIAGTGGYTVVPTFHPSFLQRGAHNLTPAVIFALRRAAQIAEARAFTPTPYTCVIDPPEDWFHAWAWDVLAQIARDRDALWLTVDTEFVEKTGYEEDTLAGVDTRGVTITHVNLAVDPHVGVTVPYVGRYREILDALLASPIRKLFWHAPADLKPLLAAGHRIAGLTEDRVWDLMLACHELQSDFPMSLGFWGPLYGDQPAWKHLAHTGDPDDFGVYRAFDAFVPMRIAYGVIPELVRSGQLAVLSRHLTAIDVFALWPSRDVGVQVDREALVGFHSELTTTATSLLNEIESSGVLGTLRPPEGLRERPAEDAIAPGARPKSSGKGKGKAERTSKQAWIAERAELVELEVTRDVQVCRTCGAEAIAKTHRCARVAIDPDAPDPPSAGARSKKRTWWHPEPDVVVEARRVRRWFWREPFNVDSPKQLLDAIVRRGHTPGTHRKTKRATTDKLTLEKLAATTGDPFYQRCLDYRAVQKVKSTYVEGTLRRMTAETSAIGATLYRLHGEVTHRPSTRRTSAVSPNLQNVVADKHGKASLAAGFRKCLRACRPGEWPSWAAGEEGARWAKRWEVGA